MENLDFLNEKLETKDGDYTVSYYGNNDNLVFSLPFTIKNGYITKKQIIDTFYNIVINQKLFGTVGTLALEVLVKQNKHYYHFEDYFWFEISQELED